MKRNKRIQLRVTEEEKNIIEEAASIEGLSSADFVRKTLLIQCKQKSKIQLQRKAKDKLANSVFNLNGQIRKLGGSVETLAKFAMQNPQLTDEQFENIALFEKNFRTVRKVVEQWKQQTQKGA